MRYFRIFDEFSGEGGDLYRWDGANLCTQMSSTRWSLDDKPRDGQTVEQLVGFLAGSRGRWEEVDGPA